MSTTGLTHVYYGDGKGKTTAALGLALRASGCGKKVIIVQFLKDTSTGELNKLALMTDIAVLRGKAPGGMFVRDMSPEQKAETKKIHDDNLKKALERRNCGECDMLILDEVLDAYSLGLLDRELLLGLLRDKPEELEVVITGHGSVPEILDYADYITEMVKHRHPYDKGIPARRGVEF